MLLDIIVMEIMKSFKNIIINLSRKKLQHCIKDSSILEILALEILSLSLFLSVSLSLYVCMYIPQWPSASPIISNPQSSTRQ